MMLRQRYLFLLIIFFSGLCFIFISDSYTRIDLFGIGPVSMLQYRDISRKEKGIITTEGCKIPDLNPFDPLIREFVKYPSDLPKCHNSSVALLGRNRTMIWIRDETFDYYNITDTDLLLCCYQHFYRPVGIEDITGQVDNRVKYDDCVIFNDTIKIKHEFVRVACSVNTKPTYVQFFLSAPRKNFTKHGENNEIVNKTGYNILIVGVDSVSRLNLLRTMPKTAKYLIMKGAIDMLGFNKIGYNTFPNLVPMFLGVKDTEVNKMCFPHRKATFDNCPFVWEWYKQAGYYTAYVEDSTTFSTFNYLKRGFADSPTDYYIRTFLREAERYVGTGSKMCMNDIYFYKVLLNYMEDLTWRLKSKRLFALFWENSISHDYLNYPMKMDDDYVEMFVNLETSGYLKETIIFFVSDHGIRWGPIRATKQGHLEERLPFLYVLTPQAFREKHKKAYDNLRFNGKRLTTPLDVYETLTDLVDPKNVDDKAISARSLENYALKRGISLFLPIPSNRTCKAAAIDDQWCTCRKELPLPKDHPKVIEAARNLVKMINYMLEDYSLCSKLMLAAVVDATEIQVGKEDKKENPWREFMVVVHTKPSEGIFEATLRYQVEDKRWQLAGPPSRLDRYGDQGWCMELYLLRPYCYCY